MSNLETVLEANSIVINLGEYITPEMKKIETAALGWQIREQSDIDTKLDKLLDNKELAAIIIKLPDQIEEVSSKFLVTFLNHAMHMLGNGPMFKTITFETNNAKCDPEEAFKKAAISVLLNPIPLLTKKQMNEYYGTL
jgi:hypothetical protein